MTMIVVELETSRKGQDFQLVRTSAQNWFVQVFNEEFDAWEGIASGNEEEMTAEFVRLIRE
jgi:hypothetical protein